jgi:hypothetical protein
LKLELGFNVLEGQRIGKTTIFFGDGTSIQAFNVPFQVGGVMMGKKLLNHVKSTVFVDKANNLHAELLFNQDSKARLKELKSKGAAIPDPDSQPGDFMCVIISRLKKMGDGGIEKEPFQYGFGSWLESLTFGDKVYWKISTPIEEWGMDESMTLPSDSGRRKDVQYMKAKEFEKAQQDRDALENQHKADEKLRAAKKK